MTAANTPTVPLAQVAVVDLTASVGGHALAQLEAMHAQRLSDQGAMLIPGLRMRLYWLRASSDALQDPALLAGLQRCIVLVGPGSSQALEGFMAFWQHGAAAAPGGSGPELCFMVMPSALMEGFVLDRLARPPMRRMALPRSDAATLWFVLLDELQRCHAEHALIHPFTDTASPKDPTMSSTIKQCMDLAMGIDGALAAALVDHRNGMCLAQIGSGMNLDLAAAGNTEVVRAKLKTMEMLGLRRGIEDILITLSDQYHLIRLLPAHPGLFLYLVLDKTKGNLALARYKLGDIERQLHI